MVKAGHCTECGRSVWLREDGCCENGHPAAAVSNPYDVPAPRSAAPTLSRRSRRWIVGGFIATACVLAGLCVVAAFLAKPLVNQGAATTDEWRSRLASDYPGWRPVSFNVFSGGGGTTWTFGLVPPGRKFVVGVQYVSKDGGDALVDDEVLRQGGRWHDRAERLLDYIEVTHIRRHRNITSVTTDYNGWVTVNWLKVTQVGPFSSRIGDYEELVFDEATGTWHVRTM